MKTVACVIGYVDANGAIHHQPLYSGEQWYDHGYYWPNQTHKTWRFIIYDWKLDNSVLSKDKLTQAEAEDVTAYLRKFYKPPIWVLEGEVWEKLGRPRSGKKYAEYERQCKVIRDAEALREKLTN